MTAKIAITAAPVHDLIAARWSPRAYVPDAVSAADQLALLEAARWAPSSYNLQPWRFVVWDRHRDRAAFDRVFAALSATNQVWVEQVPLLIGVFADTRGVEGRVNQAAPYDTGAAAFSLVLQAHALGLHAHQLGGFDRNALLSDFAIPSDWSVQALIAIGRLGDPSTLRDDLRRRELSPRTRKSLPEIAFAGGPDTPFPVPENPS